MRKLGIFFWVSLLGMSAWHLYGQQIVHLKIASPEGMPLLVSMSRKDAIHLEKFFQELITMDAFAYTFAESKPMSFGVFKKPFSSLGSFLPPNPTLRNGWKTWKKYEKVLGAERLLFWEEPNIRFRGTSFADETLLIVADPIAVANVIEQHIDDFKRILKRDHLEKLLQEKPFFSQGIKENDLLLGTLLGFGRGNAQIYVDGLKNAVKKNPSFWEPEIIDPIIIGFSRTLWTTQSYVIANMLPPMFAGNPHTEESKKLRSKYLDTRNKIIAFYEGKSYLEATLSLYRHGRIILETPAKSSEPMKTFMGNSQT